MDALRRHCLLRKYIAKSNSWFGICINTDSEVKIILPLDFKWKQSDEMDKVISELY